MQTCIKLKVVLFDVYISTMTDDNTCTRMSLKVAWIFDKEDAPVFKFAAFPHQKR